MANSGARGHVMDTLLLVGHLEALLSHCDERISNLKHDMKEGLESAEDAAEMADELNHQVEIAQYTYQARKALMDGLFKQFPKVDEKAWCELKHIACAYVVASEIYHARDFNPEAESCMAFMAEELALVVSRAFGFDPMNCLRCLDERLKEPIKENTQPEYKQDKTEK